MEKERLDKVKSQDKQLDMLSLEQRMKNDTEQDDLRVQEKLNQAAKVVEQEKKVAMAAMGITRSRDFEKERLANININRQKIIDEQTHLRQHMQREITKSASN